jgi:hypothetical protein
MGNRETDPLNESKDRSGSRASSDSKSESHEDAAPSKQDTTFNPLAQYMSEWMTHRDYSLLKPSAEHTSASDLPRPDAGVGNPPGTDTGALAALAAMTGDNTPSTAAAYTPPPATENPFLANLALPEVQSNPATVVPPPAPPAFTPPAQPDFTPPPSTDSEKSSLPDFVKPNDDDKYFKPLKRF